RLQKEGKLEAAARQASELAQRQPSNSAAQAASRTSATAEQVAANRQLQVERDQRTSGILRGIDKSGMPPKGDIEYAKDWQEKTRNRKPITSARLTAKEEAVMRSLNSPISVRFKDSRFEDVMDYIQTVTGQPIVADKAALDDAGVSYDTPVTLTLRNVSVRFLLRKLLSDLGLAYVVKDEVVEVISQVQARNMMTVKTYYIGDLARNRIQAAVLIDLIQSTIDPESWKANGGLGTIVYHPLTRSLVIKQTAEFH